jgi:hypothetical protein
MVLSAFQTIGIVVLLIHVLGDVREPPAAARAPNPVAITTAAPPADEERLRMIIREELAAQRPVPSAVTAPRAAGARDEASERLLQDRITQQIEAYRAAGSIDDAQMQELQAQIAQLDAASRKQMMSKLIRAMNAGDIKGRL